MHMQHNLLASGKPDPPGPEYLLMTSVCQPHDGRNAGKGRKEVHVCVCVDGREGGGDGKEEQEGNKPPCESKSRANKASEKVSPAASSLS